MVHTTPSEFDVLKVLPRKVVSEYDQIGSSPTDLVYRVTEFGFKKTKKEYVISFITMHKVMRLIERESL